MAQYCVLSQFYTDIYLTSVEAQGVGCCKCLPFLSPLSTSNYDEDNHALAWLWLPDYLTNLDHSHPPDLIWLVQGYRETDQTEIYPPESSRELLGVILLTICKEEWNQLKECSDSVEVIPKDQLHPCPALPIVSLVLDKPSILIRNSTFCLWKFDLGFCPHN